MGCIWRYTMQQHVVTPKKNNPQLSFIFGYSMVFQYTPEPYTPLTGLIQNDSQMVGKWESLWHWVYHIKLWLIRMCKQLKQIRQDQHVRNMLAKTVYIMHYLCCSIHRTYKMICAYLRIAERKIKTHIYIYTHSGSALGALKSLNKALNRFSCLF